MRGIPPFRQSHTVDPPITWDDWSDLFHLAIIAKENLTSKIYETFRKDTIPNHQQWKTRRITNRKAK